MWVVFDVGLCCGAGPLWSALGSPWGDLTRQHRAGVLTTSINYTTYTLVSCARMLVSGMPRRTGCPGQLHPLVSQLLACTPSLFRLLGTIVNMPKDTIASASPRLLASLISLSTCSKRHGSRCRRFFLLSFLEQS